jgi:hypothetical protein
MTIDEYIKTYQNDPRVKLHCLYPDLIPFRYGRDISSSFGIRGTDYRLFFTYDKKINFYRLSSSLPTKPGALALDMWTFYSLHDILHELPQETAEKFLFHLDLFE